MEFRKSGRRTLDEPSGDRGIDGFPSKGERKGKHMEWGDTPKVTAKEVRAREDMERALAKEEEKEVRSQASVTTAAVKDIAQGTAQTLVKGSKGHASHAGEKGIVRPNVPPVRAQEEETQAI